MRTTLPKRALASETESCPAFNNFLVLFDDGRSELVRRGLLKVGRKFFAAERR